MITQQDYIVQLTYILEILKITINRKVGLLKKAFLSLKSEVENKKDIKNQSFSETKFEIYLNNQKILFLRYLYLKSSNLKNSSFLLININEEKINNNYELKQILSNLYHSQIYLNENSLNLSFKKFFGFFSKKCLKVFKKCGISEEMKGLVKGLNALCLSEKDVDEFVFFMMKPYLPESKVTKLESSLSEILKMLDKGKGK